MNQNKNFITNAAAMNPIIGQGLEAFQTKKKKEVTIDATVWINLIVGIFNCIAAGKLSYSYNQYIGTSSGMTFLWVLLAALFYTYYLPMYALFLDPVGGLAPQVGQAGGRRRR
jgi:hypothetical protein